MNRKILTIFYTILVFWWATIFTRGIQETEENYFFSLVYGMIPLSAAIFSFFNAHKWGGFSSYVGRAILFFSSGLFAWAIGNIIYAYYNIVLKVAVPYPSIADVGFFLLYPLAALGVLSISKATGVSFALRHKAGKLIFFFIPLFLIFISYYLLFIVARGGEIAQDGGLLKLILDIAYPVGDVVVVTLAAMVYGLSRKYLGGLFRTPVIFILVGFFLAYITDFSFSYTTTTGTFFVGNWVDLFYATTFFIISFGLSLLSPSNLKQN